MTTFNIRGVQPADTCAITAIYAAAVRDDSATFETTPPDETEMARRIKAIADAGHPYLVAQRNDDVVGFAYAGTFRPRAAFALTLEDSVYVSAGARGCGTGKALLAELIEAASDRGFYQMIAVIGDSHTRAASIALHTSLGFRPMGSLEAVGRKHGQWLDIVFMQRGLGEQLLNPR